MLPTPAAGFRWVESPHGPALVCDALEPFARHLFTTRHWRLGSTPRDDDEQAWTDVGQALEIGGSPLLRLRQVHGRCVVVRRAGEPPAPRSRPEADAIVSDDPEVAIAIQVADCVPLLIADRRVGALAAVHGGWRGTAARVAVEAVEAMHRSFASRPEDLIAAIGPAIGACCYEVGRVVRERFVAAGFEQSTIARWFHERPLAIAGNPPMPGLPATPRPDHWFFDGWTATRDQLLDAGVPAAQIHTARLCTASHPQVLCSYRRDGRAAGRLAAAIRAV
ncbi:MAG: peptidoglycan editing factor PgeF [Betaproteobacteria bacterium]